MTAKWTAWTARELRILRFVYPEYGLDAVCDRLPARSRMAIKMRLSLLGIAHPRTWTVKDDAVLRLIYPEGGPRAVRELLPHRSIKSIYQRAAKLGVYRENATAGRWPASGVPHE